MSHKRPLEESRPEKIAAKVRVREIKKMTAKKACNMCEDKVEQRNMLAWFLEDQPCKRLPPRWTRVVTARFPCRSRAMKCGCGQPHFDFACAAERGDRAKDWFASQSTENSNKVPVWAKEGEEVAADEGAAWLLYASGSRSLFELAAAKVPPHQAVPDVVAERVKAARLPWNELAAKFFDPSRSDSGSDSGSDSSSDSSSDSW
tara:strand:+ start:1831 stop:2439 length:609 start_codon:yes stop_codon:yes gene_type:complete